MELTISKREISKNSPRRGNLIFILKAIAPKLIFESLSFRKSLCRVFIQQSDNGFKI